MPPSGTVRAKAPSIQRLEFAQGHSAELWLELSASDSQPAVFPKHYRLFTKYLVRVLHCSPLDSPFYSGFLPHWSPLGRRKCPGLSPPTKPLPTLFHLSGMLFPVLFVSVSSTILPQHPWSGFGNLVICSLKIAPSGVLTSVVFALPPTFLTSRDLPRVHPWLCPSTQHSVCTQ